MRFILVLACLAISPVSAQEIEFQFTVYGMEETVAKALEERLVAGGETATAAIAMLPDFVRQSRVTESATVDFKLTSGDRGRAKSSEGTITFPWHEATDGLDIEVDPVVTNGILDFNLTAIYSTRDNKDLLERIATTQITAVSGVPMLVNRWQYGKEWLLLVCTATYPNSADSSSLTGRLYIDSACYPAATSASADRDRVASTRIACRSGQRAKTEIIAWIDDENVPENDQPGFSALIDPLLAGDGTLKLVAKVTYTEEAGGTTRLDSGEKVRRLKIREMEDEMELEEGALAGRKMTVAGTDDIETREDNYVVAFKFALGGTE